MRCWAGNINGPGELKEQGDPLVTCEEGLTGPPTGTDTPVTSTTPPSNMTFVGMPSNNPQHTPAIPGVVPPGCSNPDQANAFTGPSYYNPSGTNGPLHAGYAYLVNVPAGATENLWVFNAPFSPTKVGSCNGRAGGQNQTSLDTFYYYNCTGSSSSAYPYYPNTSCSGQNPYTCTDPNLFLQRYLFDLFDNERQRP